MENNEEVMCKVALSMPAFFIRWWPIDYLLDFYVIFGRPFGRQFRMIGLVHDTSLFVMS